MAANIVKVTVDGIAVEVPSNANALEACRAAGVDVPHFCYHPRFSIVGQCRMCMVEVDGAPKVQASCTVPVRDGMVIRASSEKALAARNATMEFLLINHPLDCPICDQAGECQLQDNAVAAGLPVSRTSEPRRQFPGYDRTGIGPHVIADMTRCIQCTRCIRFCNEIAGTGELTFIERGGHTMVWTHEGHQLDNEWSACAADVCPVGALTTKEFRFRKRVWWLNKTASVCPGCEIGCNISIEHREQVVHRFLPRVNLEVNDFWMCDHGRFLAESLNGRDFLKPVVPDDFLKASEPDGRGRRETNWGEALGLVHEKLAAAKPAAVLAIGSANLSTEDNWLLAELFGKTVGTPNVEFDADQGPLRRIRNPKAIGADGGFLKGTVAAPNARGAEAAGVRKASGESALGRLLTGSLVPDVLYVADAAFSARTADPAFVAKLRKAKFLVIHARTRSALTDVADVVLPVSGLTGKDGSFLNVQGRVQRFDVAFVPPPIVKTDLEVLLHLGQRFGVFETRWTAADVFGKLAATVPAYGGLAWDAPAVVGLPPPVSPAAAYDVLRPPRTSVDDTDKLPAAAGKA
jgi:NADH-quinone oxidoreductase subunit G